MAGSDRFTAVVLALTGAIIATVSLAVSSANAQIRPRSYTAPFPGQYVPPMSGPQTPAALSRRYYAPNGTFTQQRQLMRPSTPPTYRPAPRAAKRLSCKSIRSQLRAQHYGSVKATDCQGSTYSFRVKKGKKSYTLSVDAYSGAVLRSLGR